MAGYTVRTAVRTVELIRLVHRIGPVTLTDVREQTCWPLLSTHNLLHTLVDAGVLVQLGNPRSRRCTYALQSYWWAPVADPAEVERQVAGAKAALESLAGAEAAVVAR
jgi:DNA-binding IclR family transcriptional regulator